MFAAENDFLDDAVLGEVDETERLLDAGRLVGALHGSHDLSEGREILDKVVFGDGLLQGCDEDAAFVLALLLQLHPNRCLSQSLQPHLII